MTTARRTLHGGLPAARGPGTTRESLRVRLLIAFLLVGVATVGTLGVAVLSVGPGYFADAMGHMPGGPMGAAMDAVTREAFVHALLRSLAAATLTAVMAAAIVSFAVAARLARPMTRLAGAARRLASGHYAERVADDEPGELRDLAVSFNEMAESLEATERRRLQLVGDVAHELRTPLTTLDGYVEGLEDGVIAPGPQTWHLLAAETGRLTRLVEDLAELWRAEAHQLTLNIDRVDTGDVMRAIEARFSQPAQSRGVGISVQGPPATVLADSGRLTQILSNYVSNALRFAPHGTRVRLLAEAVGDRVRLSVADEGAGLARDQLEAVFERFYRVDPARTRAAGGSGIGLAIVRALAEAMGGRAWVESRGPGTGATFFVELPAP